MRDQDLLNRFSNIEGAVASDFKNIVRQSLLMRTRIDAIERVLFGSRFGILRSILLQLISPRLMATRVRYVHNDQIRKMNEALSDAENKGRIKPAPVSIAVAK